MGTKICTKCKEEKALDDFCKRTDAKDGKASSCKICRNKLNRYDRIKSAAHYRQFGIDRRRTIERRFVEWKRGAKKRDIPFLITIEDCKRLPMKCYYTGLELTMDNYKNNTVSLERLDSSKPYTVDNIVFCCKRINEMKSNMTIEDFVMFCTLVYENKGLTNINK